MFQIRVEFFGEISKLWAYININISVKRPSIYAKPRPFPACEHKTYLLSLIFVLFARSRQNGLKSLQSEVPSSRPAGTKLLN